MSSGRNKAEINCGKSRRGRAEGLRSKYLSKIRTIVSELICPPKFMARWGGHVRGTGNLHCEDAAVSFPWRQAGVKQLTDRDKEIINHICDKKYRVEREKFIKCFLKIIGPFLFFKSDGCGKCAGSPDVQQTSRTLPRVPMQQRHLAAAAPQLIGRDERSFIRCLFTHYFI